MNRADQDIIQMLRTRLRGLAGRECRAMARRLSKEVGLSVSYIYEMTRDVRPSRKKRADSRQRRIQLSEDQKTYILAQVVRNGASMEAAIAAATDPENAEFPWYTPLGDAPTAQTVNQWLRTLNLGRKARQQISSTTPYRRWTAKAANEVWLLDGTLGEQFYLAPDDMVYWHDPRSRQKPKDPRAVILGLADRHSRAQYFDIFEHESAESLGDFMYGACSKKDDPREFPMMGIPDVIYTDMGPAMSSQVFKTFCSVFEIRLERHMPYRPWAKGQIERAFRALIDRQKLKKQSPRWTKSEFRNFLYRYMLYYNNRVHSETNEKPFERWVRSIESGEGRFRDVPPETLMEFLKSRRIERTVKPAGEISLNNRRFELTRELRAVLDVGQKVEVLFHPRAKDECMIAVNGVVHRLRAEGIIRARFGAWEGEARPIRHSEREKVLALINSVDTKKMLAETKGVGLPIAGPAHEVKREPVTWEEQLRKGGPEREAVDEYIARDMLLDAGHWGNADTFPAARAMLERLVTAKRAAGEPLYKDEIFVLAEELDKVVENIEDVETRVG